MPNRSFLSFNTPENCRSNRQWQRLFPKEITMRDYLPAHYAAMPVPTIAPPAIRGTGQGPELREAFEGLARWANTGENGHMEPHSGGEFIMRSDLRKLLALAAPAAAPVGTE